MSAGAAPAHLPAPLPFAGRERAVIRGSVAGKAGELLGQTLLILLVPRLLGPAEYGGFARALAVVTLCSSSISIGGPVVMSRFIPAAPASERRAIARALFTRVARWHALQLACVAVAAGVLAAAAPRHFPLVLTLLIVIALAFDVAATILFQLALGLGRTGAWSFRYAVQNALLVAAALIGHAAAGLEGAVAGIAVASAGGLAWGIWAVAGQLAAAPAGGAVPSGAMRFAALQALGTLFTVLCHRGGVVAVALLTGSGVQTGFAALAYGVALAAAYAALQMFTVQLPLLVERCGSLREGEVAARRLAARSIALLTPLAVVGAALCPGVVLFVLGDGFADAATPVALALAILPLVPALAVANQISALRLRAGARSLAQAIGAAVFVATAAWTVPAWQAAGASSALLTGTLATVLAGAIALPGALTRGLMGGALCGSGLVVAVGLLAAAP